MRSGDQDGAGYFHDRAVWRAHSREARRVRVPEWFDLTEIRVFPVDQGPLRAYVNITLNGALAIRGLRVICSRGHFFVAMPNKTRRDGELQDVVYPVNSTMREWMEERILGAYRQLMQRRREVSASARIADP